MHARVCPRISHSNPFRPTWVQNGVDIHLDGILHLAHTRFEWGTSVLRRGVWGRTAAHCACDKRTGDDTAVPYRGVADGVWHGARHRRGSPNPQAAPELTRSSRARDVEDVRVAHRGDDEPDIDEDTREYRQHGGTNRLRTSKA